MLPSGLRSISLSKLTGTNATNDIFILIRFATFVVILSINGAVIRKSYLPGASPLVFIIGLVGARHFWVMRVATKVSFSAFTRRCLASRIELGKRLSKTSMRSGKSKLLSLSSLRARRLKGSAVLMTAPFFHIVSTMELRSATSWILHVDRAPLLLREASFTAGRWSE